jgi:hypothetical protein
MLLFLAGCGSDDQATRPNDFTPLTSIEIVSPLSSIAPNTSIPLQAKGNFSGLFTKDDIGDRVTWESLSTTVADFPFPGVPGRIQGLTPGTATIRASSGDVEAFFDLEVTNATITALTIDQNTPTVHKGLTIQLAASGTFSVGLPQDLTFDAAWTSSDTAVATVSDAFASKGLAEGITKGTTTISATFGTFPPATTTLTVTDPLLQSITITPANPSVLSLLKTTIKASGNYSDSSTSEITSLVAWTSSQPLVATIAAGEASTLKSGSTVISADLGGVHADTSLKVTGGDLNVNGIVLSQLNPTMAVGTSQRIFATGSFSNGTTRDISGQTDWRVDDSTKATVTRDNNLAWITANAATVALTPATIFAKRGAVEGSTALTVENLTLPTDGLSITPTSLDLTVGTSDRFTVTGTYTGGHTQDLTSSANWSSPAAAVEVFNIGVNKGRVKGAVAATNPAATITATYGGQTATATVDSVVQRTLQSLAISAQPATFIPGTQVQFTATATYSDNTTHVVTEDTVWSIDKTNVAILADTLNQPGLTVAVDSGTATLTAAFDGKTATRTLTVP